MPTAMTATIERQARLDPGAADRLAGIYEVSFPPSERENTADLVASIAAGERLLYVARRDAELIGFAVVFSLDDLSVALLEYLAVDPQERNAGVGGALLTHLRTNLGSDSGALGMVLEVEPAEEVDREESTLRKRRIGFYLRHGASVVECAPRYRTPNLERRGETVPFTLLWVPLSTEAPQKLAGTHLRRCVEAILTESYELSRDDPLVREVVDDLAC
jgi:ribosomal protein S18 acetylase RimI-like enzyme